MDDTESTILDRLAAGETLRSICRAEGMPSARTVARWGSGLVPERAEFAARYGAAREIGATLMAEEIIEIADAATAENARVAETRIKARQWFVSKLHPAMWGDRVPSAAVPAAVGEHPAPPPVAPTAEEWSAWARQHIDATDAKVAPEAGN